MAHHSKCMVQAYQKILHQLGFSSNVTSDTVTLTDLIEDFSFCTEFKSGCKNPVAR
jgi:hypothetical protein